MKNKSHKEHKQHMMKGHNLKRKLLFFAGMAVATAGFSQNTQNNPGSNHANKFEQLGNILPTPNEYRTASGAPGPKYWQQRADYDIKATLDEKALKLTGSETVTYHNNSGDVLSYLWLQLDENEHSSVNNANYQTSNNMPRQADASALLRMSEKGDNGYGINITRLTDALGKNLTYTVNKTMMRVELPQPLKPGARFTFRCDWNYKIPDRLTKGGRGGYEYFQKTAITCSPLHSGIPAFVCTATSRAGKTSSLPAVASLPSPSATLRCR
jgi:hypothetical protein